MEEDFNDDITVPNITKMHQKPSSSQNGSSEGQRSDDTVNCNGDGASHHYESSARSRSQEDGVTERGDSGRYSPQPSTSYSYQSPAIPNQSLHKV